VVPACGGGWRGVKSPFAPPPLPLDGDKRVLYLPGDEGNLALQTTSHNISCRRTPQRVPVPGVAKKYAAETQKWKRRQSCVFPNPCPPADEAALKPFATVYSTLPGAIVLVGPESYIYGTASRSREEARGEEATTVGNMARSRHVTTVRDKVTQLPSDKGRLRFGPSRLAVDRCFPFLPSRLGTHRTTPAVGVHLVESGVLGANSRVGASRGPTSKRLPVSDGMFCPFQVTQSLRIRAPNLDSVNPAPTSGRDPRIRRVRVFMFSLATRGVSFMEALRVIRQDRLLFPAPAGWAVAQNQIRPAGAKDPCASRKSSCRVKSHSRQNPQ